MSFFSSRYNTPGKGISKSAPQKNPFFVFFEIYKEKFWNLGLLNLLFMAFLIPALLISFGLATVLEGVIIANPLVSPAIILASAPLIFLGPVWAAVIRITRDFGRREPCFFWYDFKSAIKNNWKQSLAISAITMGLIWLLSIAIPFYWTSIGQNQWNLIPFGICIMAGIILLFMQYYLYMMIVTLDLRVRDLLKNALIFSFLCLGRNFFMTIVLLLALIITAAVVFYSFFYPILYVISLTLVAGVFFSFIAFFTSFQVFPQIKKHILDPYYAKHPEQSAEGVGKQTAPAAEVEFREAGEELSRESSEYVYYNGKMVHRSLLEQEQVFQDDSGTRSENEKK